MSEHWNKATRDLGASAPTKTDERPRCLCGAVISKHNSGLLCATCDRIHRQATLMDSKADRERIAARHVAGIFTRPEVFENPQAYLKALDDALRNLAEEVGVDRFDPTKAEWWPREEAV